MPRFRFSKLVRDKIVQLCLDDDLITDTQWRVLGEMEYKQALKDKIFEEGEEIPIRVEADDEVKAEIADLQTVLDHLRSAYGIDEDEIKAIQTEKAEKKGGFASKHFIDTVTCDENSPWTKDFRARPGKYPVVSEEKSSLPKLPTLETGAYRHYKGGEYEVVGAALHSETLEPMVVYKALYDGEHELWARPYDMFVGTVEVDGRVKPRFEKIT